MSTDARITSETPTGELVDGRPLVRLTFAGCDCWEVRKALPSPLRFKGSRLEHDCPNRVNRLAGDALAERREP